MLTNILLLVDAYDLYGRVAVPKSHRAAEVADIYRLVAAGKGVFINPALTEPFGLTCSRPLPAAFRWSPPRMAARWTSSPTAATANWSIRWTRARHHQGAAQAAA